MVFIVVITLRVMAARSAALLLSWGRFSTCRSYTRGMRTQIARSFGRLKTCPTNRVPVRGTHYADRDDYSEVRTSHHLPLDPVHLLQRAERDHRALVERIGV